MNVHRTADGILLVRKPPGVTSHDVVERVRRGALARGRKVGHAGTLDPFATGLLLLLVGRATRAQRFLMSLPKTYATRARFGVRSDTGDPTGTLAASARTTSAAEVEAALPRMRGEIAQRVPLTSAVKVGGERLYRKARRGEQFETPVRSVLVSRFELLEFDRERQVATFEIDCSSGTYVRQLVADLGELCACGAHCESLERLAIGGFRLEDAAEERLIPLADALSFMPERPLSEEEARAVGHGRSVADPGESGEEGAVRLTHGERLVAVAQRRDGVLRPVTVFVDG